MKSIPKVSIGLPVHNGELYLHAALDSLVAQTFTDFELIISDNASDDHTEAICREYAKQDGRIRYLRNSQNIGAAKNYNLTFHQALGSYFKWAAADDICAPGFLAACVSALDTNPSAVLAYPRAQIIDETGAVTGDFRDRGSGESNDCRERFTSLLYGLRECTPIFGLFRANALSKTPLIASYLSSDKNLILELSLHGQILQIPEVLFFRRNHEAASTRSHHDDQGRRNDTELSAWYDPGNRGKLVLPWWRKISELTKAVSRSPISAADKYYLFKRLGRFALWKRDLLGRELVLTFRNLPSRKCSPGLQELLFRLRQRRRKNA